MFCPSLRIFRTVKLPIRAPRPSRIICPSERAAPLECKASVAPFTPRFFHQPPKNHNMDKSKGKQSQVAPEALVDSSTSTNGYVGHPASHTMTSTYPKSYPTLNPVDIYREHIAEQLASITGVGAPEIFTKLQWTQTQDKGDLMLPVPALRIKGKKPNELATDWAEKVGTMPIPCLD